QGAEAFARAAEEHDDGAAVVAGEVDAGVESLGAQLADDGPVDAELRLAGGAWHAPDAVDGGVMLQERDGGLRDKGVEFAIGEAATDGGERGDAHDGVAQGFKLDG